MKQRHKGKAKNILSGLLAFILVILTFYSRANFIYHSFENYSFKIYDTIPVKTNFLDSSSLIEKTGSPIVEMASNIDSTLRILKNETLVTPKRDTFNFKSSKDSLSAPVNYHADDSMVFDIPEKKLLLYGKTSKVNYSDNKLSAPFIQFDQSTNTVKAFLIKDSTGKVLAYPSFMQADFKSISDTIYFNMKTGKGLTKGTYTQQGEMFVYGEKIKKVDANVFYALNGRFTSCNLDTPHFAFVSNKVKFINKKVAFTGPVHPEVDGVPLPIVLPFGIYPLTQGRHSGFIAPNFTANEQLGLAMEGLGYYKILNPNWDVVTRGTLYSYGGWTFNVNPRYFKRYRYQGNFSFDMQRFKTGFKGDPDYSSSKTFNIRWTHSVDSKARPGETFSANVNAGSSKFNAQVPNSPSLNFTNQLSSSITFTKAWKNKPFNLSASANHDQNTNSRLINIRFPDLSFNVNTQYPFRRKEALGEYKWYENIGIALSTNARSLSYFYDTAHNISEQLNNNFKWGASHSVPISLSLPSLGALQVSPSVTYQERWYQERFIRKWNPIQQKVDTVINNGFYTARDMGFGIGMSTRIFGMLGFGKNSKVQAIRHEIRPSISAIYKPNMNAANYYTTQIDTSGNVSKYSYYERSVFGAFSDSRFGGLSFGIDNVLQMKVKNSKDTTAASMKKVSLLDGLSINSSYNFLADSFRISPINLSARSNLFDKINITANAQFDPYLYNSQGRKIDKLVWTQHPVSLGRLTSGGVSLQSRFSGGEKSGKKDNSLSSKNSVSNNVMDENEQEASYMHNNPNEFVDFSSPWTADISYSLRFSSTMSYTNPGKFDTKINQDFNWNGNISLTPKWKVGMSGSFNITEHQLGVLSVNLSRDLHCWQMNIVMSPVGKYRYFSINISPKSSMLRDLHVNRTRYFYDL
ncbi:MAG: putative LPS assembly protein LptD [Bacteroidota bacterium]